MRQIFSKWLLTASVLVSGRLRAQDFSYDFDCPPEVASAPGATTKTFEAFVTLTTANNPDPKGAQGWSLSVTAEGGSIDAIETSGLHVSTIFDDDGDPATPFVDPFDLDFANADFNKAFLATLPSDPAVKGAISAVVLHLSKEMTLQPSGTQRVARLTVSAPVPSQVTLRFLDGLQAPSLQPVPNIVTFHSSSLRPALGSCVVRIIAREGPSLFTRGDPNDDGKHDIADAVWILNELFLGGPPTACRAAADSNHDGRLDLSDGLRIISFHFLGGPPPPAPFPACGPESHPDEELGCDTPPTACR